MMLLQEQIDAASRLPPADPLPQLSSSRSTPALLPRRASGSSDYQSCRYMYHPRGLCSYICVLGLPSFPLFLPPPSSTSIASSVFTGIFAFLCLSVYTYVLVCSYEQVCIHVYEHTSAGQKSTSCVHLVS